MSIPFVVLFAGSRDWTDPEPIHTQLDAIAVRQAGRPLIVRHGDCPDGADQHCAGWIRQARILNWDVTADPNPARWDDCGPDCPNVSHRRVKRPGDTAHPGLLADYCPNAGPRRNRGMVDLGADVMLAAPLGRSYGTWNCMKFARSAGIPIVKIPQAGR